MRSEFPSNQLPEHIHSTHSAFYRTRHLERNAELGTSLHVLQQNLLAAAVIEFRGPAVGVAGNSLGGFKSPVIFQKIRASTFVLYRLTVKTKLLRIILMGRAFESEIANLAETSRYCSAIPVDNLIRFGEASLRPVTVVGVGGSYTAACFAVVLFESLRALATAKTTLDFSSSTAHLGDSNVLLLSGSGRNKDILSALHSAVAREANAVLGLCARKESPLKKASEVFWETKFLDFDLPAGKDGFLATNSLLATVLVLAKAFFPDEWDKEKFARIEEECVSAFSVGPADLNQGHLLVLHGKWSRPAAVDLESKCSEAALAGVQLCDYRHFAHGRHNWIAKHSSDTLVVPLITAEDQPLALRTLKLLPRSTRVFPLETRAQACEGSIRLLVQVFKFTAALGRARSIDPGRPGVPPFGSKIYNLRAFPAKRLFRATRIDCKNQATARKLTAGAIQQGLDDAVTAFIDRLEKARFGAIVFDFDGTLCSSQDRMHGVSSALRPHLLGLVEHGVLIGIATGRGKSAREAPAKLIPKNRWERTIVGYYNGSVLGILGDDGLPDNSVRGDQDLRHLAQKLLSLPDFDNICTLKFGRIKSLFVRNVKVIGE